MSGRNKKNGAQGLPGVVLGKKTGSRLLPIALVIFLAVLLCGAGLFGYNRFVVTAGTCRGESSYKRAAEVLQAPRTPEADTLIKDFQATKNYLNNPNCIYPVVEYNLAKQDLTEARKYYSSLQKAAGSDDAGLSKAYESLNVRTVKDVKTKVDALEKIIEARGGSKLDALYFN